MTTKTPKPHAADDTDGLAFSPVKTELVDRLTREAENRAPVGTCPASSQGTRSRMAAFRGFTTTLR